MPEISDIVESATWRFLDVGWPGRFVHEPNGNSFPDFSMGGRIAVECTRLTSEVERGGVVVRVTQNTTSFQNSLENALRRLGSLGSEQTFFLRLGVSVAAYQNPRMAVSELAEFLGKVDPSAYSSPANRANLSCGVTVGFLPAAKFSGRKYELGSWGGPESSGWVPDVLSEQVLSAMRRKTISAKKNGARFGEYWLAVGSVLTSGSLGRSSREMIRDILANQEFWSALILVNLFTPERSQLIRL